MEKERKKNSRLDAKPHLAMSPQSGVLNQSSNSHYGPVNPRRVRAPGLHRRKTALL